MKKLTKIAATLAALVLALALAGCNNDEELTEAAEQADWSGFTMIDSVDKLDFKVGTYEMKEVGNIEYETTSELETRIATVEIKSTEEVIRTPQVKTRTYNDDVSYNEDKKYYATMKEYYSWDDSTRTVTFTYSPEDSRRMTLLAFKQDVFPWEDKIDHDGSWTYTDKKLGVKDGVIQMSYTETYTETKGGKTDTQKVYITTTLTPQK